MLPLHPVPTATPQRARWSTSSYTVPHYNHTGTDTTYIHWSTSGSSLRRQWASSGMPPSYRGPYYTLWGCGLRGRCSGGAATCRWGHAGATQQQQPRPQGRATPTTALPPKGGRTRTFATSTILRPAGLNCIFSIFICPKNSGHIMP